MMAQVMFSLLTGLLVSSVMGALVNPLGEKPRRPTLFVGMSGLAWWLTFFAVACLISQRPYFSVTLVVVLHGILLLINYSKYTSLKEPFVLQDFEYFVDMLRHPRLYIPFFGVFKTLFLIVAGIAAIALYFYYEPPLNRVLPQWWLVPVGAFGVAYLAALLAWKIRPQLFYEPIPDIQITGLVALMHAHLAEYRVAAHKEIAGPANTWPLFDTAKPLPHLVMVQSESFFDPRPFYPFIKPSVLENWDCHSQMSDAGGRLNVPAWGANTVRTEAAVLTGLSQEALGIYRYNPYSRLVKKPVASLASHLRKQGYKTICVHPYPAHFYLRHQVMPALGFDHFIDIRAFSSAERSGQYVGDKAVAHKVEELLAAAQEPLFIFVITMENHGPLQLEQPKSDTDVYNDPPTGPVRDLTVYLQHLKNADQMLSQITSALKTTSREGSLCWYGDHVPIMPDVYRCWGEPEAQTPWMVWSTNTKQHVSTQAKEQAKNQTLSAEGLAHYWLDIVKRNDRI